MRSFKLVFNSAMVQNTETKAYHPVDDLQVQLWLSEGNTLEPAETPEEIAARELQEINAAAEAYLASTDKWAIREFETGKSQPDGVKAMRASKRLEVNNGTN